MEKSHNIRVRVYLEDTDALGIVYYCSFLKYMERARCEWLRSCGLAPAGWRSQEVMLVVRSLKMRFHKPAHLDDLLRVDTLVQHQRGASLLLQQHVFRLSDDELLCTATVEIASVGQDDLRPHRLPSALRHKPAKQMVCAFA